MKSLQNYTLANAESVYGASLSQRIDSKLRISRASDDVMLPAIVKSYDSTTNNITVSIPILYLTSQRDDDGVYRTEQRADVTVTAWQPSCGGITVFLPYSEGDVGWVEAADRDTESFKASDMTEAVSPGSFFLRNFRFGRFIPDAMRGKTVSEGDVGSMVIQNDDGSVKIKINKDSGIEITSSNNAVMVNGDITVAGTVTASEFIGGGVVYTTHIHGSGGNPPYNP